ncbi:lmo0937 family membrane protein [Candidatus Woesebacteria bacterium]|nr:lmo0937 family membrane protein [Candidatus Woesebacteria bacterium]
MGLIDIIIIILIISWIGGFSLKIGGGLIHALLVIAVIVFIARLLGFKI